MRTRIKICGITRAADALAAVDAGADAVGFNFYRPGRRYVTPARAATIAAGLPPSVARVGVFVNAPRRKIEEICAVAGLTAVQLHGDEGPEFAAALSLPVIKAFRGRVDAATLRRYRVAGFLLDGAPRGIWGGAGTAAPEASAMVLWGRPDFILAGGLTAANVAARCRRFRPGAVDVASGVETAPGIKDHALIAAFVAAVRSADEAPPVAARIDVDQLGAVPTPMRVWLTRR